MEIEKCLSGLGFTEPDFSHGDSILYIIRGNCCWDSEAYCFLAVAMSLSSWSNMLYNILCKIFTFQDALGSMIT